MNKNQSELYSGPVKSCLSDLADEGYEGEFLVNQDVLILIGGNETLTPQEVTVDRACRIEDKQNSDSEQTVYAISASNGSKGTLMDTYGVHVNKQIEEFLNKVPD